MTPFSHSRLSAYENCPRQYDYRYIQKIPRDGEGIEAFLGKRVHEVLERLYHHVGRHGRPPSLRQVLERYRADWEQRFHDKIDVVRSDLGTEHFRARGETCLENYYRAHYPFDQGETVALEHNVSLRLDADGRYLARGIIDRLVRTAPGAYEIHDYKTSGWLPPKRRLEQDRQLALYQIGVEQSYQDAERVDLVWHYLTFNQTLRSSRTPEQLDDLRRRTIGLIDEIKGASEYPARPGPLCRWCDYRDICPDAALPAPEPPPLDAGDWIPPEAGALAMRGTGPARIERRSLPPPPAPREPQQLRLL